jgi:hypothetical protein
MLAIGRSFIRWWRSKNRVDDAERVDFECLRCLCIAGSVACGDGRCTGVFVTASCGARLGFRGMECCDSATSLRQRPGGFGIRSVGGRDGSGDRLDFDAFRGWPRNASANGASAVSLDRGGEHALPDLWNDHGVQFRGAWEPFGFIPRTTAWSAAGSRYRDGGSGRRLDRGVGIDARSVLFGAVRKTVSMGVCGVASGGLGLQDRRSPGLLLKCFGEWVQSRGSNAGSGQDARLTKDDDRDQQKEGDQNGDQNDDENE